MESTTTKGSSKDYGIRLIETLYDQVPSFTDVFDEETWYLFVGCFVAITVIVVFILAKFVTIKPVE